MEQIPAKHIVTKTKSSDWFGLDYNMNIYRGCCHGCITVKAQRKALSCAKTGPQRGNFHSRFLHILPEGSQEPLSFMVAP